MFYNDKYMYTCIMIYLNNITVNFPSKHRDLKEPWSIRQDWTNLKSYHVYNITTTRISFTEKKQQSTDDNEEKVFCYRTLIVLLFLTLILNKWPLKICEKLKLKP